MFEASAPKLVDVPNPRRATRNGMYDQLNMQAVEKGQSIFIADAVNAETGEVEKSYEQALRGVANRLNTEFSKVTDRPALKSDGSPKLDSRSNPVMERERDRHFVIRRIEDGKLYGKKFEGKAGYAIVRDL